jgi:hypothetical protein
VAAEYIAPAERLTLLYEPRMPSGEATSDPSWRRTRDGWERRHERDAFGARVQVAMARYYLGDWRRPDVARFLVMSERGAQAHLSGKAFRAYTEPVLAALRRLGISVRRGDWTVPGSDRARELVRAQADVLARAESVLRGDHWTPAGLAEIRADMRLLSFAVGADQ